MPVAAAKLAAHTAHCENVQLGVHNIVATVKCATALSAAQFCQQIGSQVHGSRDTLMLDAAQLFNLAQTASSQKERQPLGIPDVLTRLRERIQELICRINNYKPVLRCLRLCPVQSLWVHDSRDASVLTHYILVLISKYNAEGICHLHRLQSLSPVWLASQQECTVMLYMSE